MRARPVATSSRTARTRRSTGRPREREHLGLGRLLEGQHREPVGLAHQAASLPQDDDRSAADLIGAEAVQRMTGRSQRGGNRCAGRSSCPFGYWPAVTGPDLLRH